MRRFRVKHEKYWVNERAFLRVDVMRNNREIFERLLVLYKTDLCFANALRYLIELVDEQLAAIKANNKLVVVAAHKRYADHWNNTVRVMARVRGVRI